MRCVTCGRELEPSEPIWRMIDPIGTNWIPRIGPLCAACRPEHVAALPSGPCEQCGRPVIIAGHRQTTRIFCDDSCRWRWKNARRPERQVVTSRKVCPLCSQLFTASRRYQIWCSSTCRQQAGRRRRAMNLSQDSRAAQ